MKFRLLIFFLLPARCFCQSDDSGFKNISCAEKWWVVFHPLVAKEAYHISMEARSISKEMEKDSVLDHDADGGQVDAFRHSYWMARLAQEMCGKKARSLGKAHERGNYRDFKKRRNGEELFSDSVARSMDLFNNEIGIALGKKNKSLPAEALKKMILEKIMRGEMKIILKDANGNSLDCSGNVISLEKYSGTWNIPRCLVQSGKN